MVVIVINQLAGLFICVSYTNVGENCLDRWMISSDFVVDLHGFTQLENGGSFHSLL